MMCDKCGYEPMQVWYSRYEPIAVGENDYSVVVRKRKCHACGHRIITCEVIAPDKMPMYNFVEKIVGANNVIHEDAKKPHTDWPVKNGRNGVTPYSTTIPKIPKMRELRASGKTLNDIARICDVSTGTVRNYTDDIVARKRQKSIVRGDVNACYTDRYGLNTQQRGGDVD